ncbi:MAG TPA: DUF1992 domain-containing protein [Candidatus Methylomirabilis sp.]|nr:DUF1992 domain-containing protein [Candidatus Methylomirabilis sp.]
MTQSKPPHQSWDSWVEEQIQQAQAEGAFDRLEGEGQPINGLDAPYDPLWWVKKLLEREKLSMLPPALEVRAKVDRALGAIGRLRDESAVRALVSALNAEIVRANRTSGEGPPTTQAPLAEEEILSRWRSERDRA